MRYIIILFFIFSLHSLAAQRLQKTPVISYVLKVDETDLSGYNVEMHIKNVPDTFRIAMVKHPEYDDQFWRFVKDIHAETTISRLL